MAKIVSFNQLKKKKSKLIIKGKKPVLVGGCFDLIHYGHIKFLKKAKAIGDFLIVALESDKFIKKDKKRDPIHKQKERAEILASLDMIDLVVTLPFFSSDQQYFNMIKTINPKIIAVTQGDPKIRQKKKQARKVGAIVRVVTPLLNKFSTRKIIMKFT